VSIAATRGVAALVPTTASNPPLDVYSAIPPPDPPDGVNSAAAETSFVARAFPPADRVHPVPNAFACEERNVVWYEGIAYSVLHPLPVPPEESFHTTSVYELPLDSRVVPPTAMTVGLDAG
jgi:predicted RNA methylase